MNSNISSGPLQTGAEPYRDENHDESRRNLYPVTSESREDPEDGECVSRDQNHDESRINGFDPEVAAAIGSNAGEKPA
jgi:hypothetical protein